MAKFKGEITLENGMVLVMDYLALARLEELYDGKSAFEVLNQLENNTRVIDMINVIMVSAKRHNPDITIEEAADIAAEYPETLAQLFTAAAAGAGVDVDNVKAGNAKKAPVKK